MSAISASSDVWVVKDPELTCGCVSRTCMVTRRVVREVEAVRNAPDYWTRHAAIWLSEAEAMRDFRSRARLFKALRRRWTANSKAVLP